MATTMSENYLQKGDLTAGEIPELHQDDIRDFSVSWSDPTVVASSGEH